MIFVDTSFWVGLFNRRGSRESLRVEPRFIEEDVEKDAVRWLRAQDERPYSFVDATSFQLMHRLHVKRAFAFDGDFTAAGFEDLR